MKRRLLMLAPLAIASGIALGASSDELLPGFKAAPEQLTMIESAEKLVKQDLRDADSAKFRNIFISETPTHTPVVCGELNAKNGMGGYTGFQRMFVLLPANDPSAHVEDGSALFSAVWDKACKR